MTTQALTTITAASGPPAPNGWQCWLVALAFGGALFLGARAWDRYRARAERDRILADAYRLAAAKPSTTTATSATATSVEWTTPTRPAQRKAPSPKRGRPEGTGPRQREVLELLAAHPEGLTRAQIATETGVTANNASQTLLRLHRRGRAERRLTYQAGERPTARWFAARPEADR